jgi:hypothetical protein
MYSNVPKLYPPDVLTDKQNIWDMTLTLFLISYNIGVKKATASLRPKFLFLLAYPKEQKDVDNGLFEGKFASRPAHLSVISRDL